MTDQLKPGTIGWHDLTIDDADGLRDFYAAVVGWEPEAVSMGEYSDYTMKDSGGNGVAGVCHKRGGNADIPSQWLMYIVVADIEAALAQCRARGGSVVSGPKTAGGAHYAVIRDPAGAVAALYQSAS